jgi:hypothetical protein
MSKCGNESYWTEELEKMGADQVRLLLASSSVGTGPGASFPYVGKRTTPGGQPNRNFVESWLSAKLAEEEKRSKCLYRLAQVAAVSGVIGAALAFVSLFY